MIYVVVSALVKEGRMSEYLGICSRLRPLVLAEKGCLAYDYAKDIHPSAPNHEPSDPARITLIEEWESPEALSAHNESAHVKEYLPRLRELREGTTIRMMETVL